MATAPKQKRQIRRKSQNLRMLAIFLRTLAIGIVVYGVKGVWDDDVFLTGKGGGSGVHLHGTEAHLAFTSMLLFSIAILALTRNHQKPEVNIQWMKYVFRPCLGLSIAFQLASIFAYIFRCR